MNPVFKKRWPIVLVFLVTLCVNLAADYWPTEKSSEAELGITVFNGAMGLVSLAIFAKTFGYYTFLHERWNSLKRTF